MKQFINNGVVFVDIDNTLLDFDLAIKDTLKTGLDKYNLMPYQEHMYDVFTKINNQLWKELEKGNLSFEELKKVRFNLVFKALGIQFDGIVFESYFRERIREVVFPIEGSLELLKYLNEKYVVVLASNGPQEQQTSRIKLANMFEYVDLIYTSELIGFSKPSKDYFSKVFEYLNKEFNISLDKEKCIMIGDSLSSDISGAKGVGIKTIFFDKHNEHETKPDNADFMVKKISEIKKLLNF